MTVPLRAIIYRKIFGNKHGHFQLIIIVDLEELKAEFILYSKE